MSCRARVALNRDSPIEELLKSHGELLKLHEESLLSGRSGCVL